jgi:hypothetical protein
MTSINKVGTYLSHVFCTALYASVTDVMCCRTACNSVAYNVLHSHTTLPLYFRLEKQFR